MTLRMLIDARHREETRVAIVKGNRIEEFDFESAEHKQLKGNIYLAKVTRVEPSLQAAFVDYGGNRHGFLAFSEIHPDYYQIPKEDREALLREEREHAAEEAALRADEDDDELIGAPESGDGDVEDMAPPPAHHDDDEHDDNEHDGHDGPHAGEERIESGEEGAKPAPRRGKGDDAAEELRRKRMALRRRYKIQDVIRRRQVLLVQVVKEERGNKGAALTTYLSLAGRYCVLMPNTSHGGGISRKISNAADRKRLKSIIAEMRLPTSMGCIVRTAGLSRTKPEIKRDFDYLARLWDEIRENTLKSAAPALIHNDSDLIKRAIRDIYNKDIEEVIVEGEDGYRAAKDFMKLLMPSHARRVKSYADTVSLFQRFGVEDQLAAMYHPVVQLKSGGYLVINPTEALVSIDINSGRSTREHGIEQTAVATNLEAAREIARQLRLRDMAGLVVIDFIDMEVNSNVRKVEKAMKESLKDDRARIQVGRISGFGLMEMSRQRLRTGVLEASTRECPHCEGTGLVRTASSAGLSALRMLEEEAARGRGSLVTLRASQEAAFYVLNNKRRELDEIEMRYGVTITILPDGEVEGARMSVEAGGPRPTQVVTYAPIVDEEDDLDIPEDEYEEEEEEAVEAESDPQAAREPRGDRPERSEADGEGGRRRRRRSRRRRGGRREEGEGADGVETDGAEEGEPDAETAGDQANDGQASDDHAGDDQIGDDRAGNGDRIEGETEEQPESNRRGRRGRRGGRRRRGGEEGAGESMAASTDTDAAIDSRPEAIAAEAEPALAPLGDAAADALGEAEAREGEAGEVGAALKTRRRPRARKAAEPVAAVAAATAPLAEPVTEASAVDAAPVEGAVKPKRTRKKAEASPVEAPAVEAPAVEALEEEPSPKPKRTRRKAAASEPGPVAEAPATETPAPETPAPETSVTEMPGTETPAAGEAAAPAEPRPAADMPAADAPALAEGEGGEEDGPPRRGWWQRTFGA